MYFTVEYTTLIMNSAEYVLKQWTTQNKVDGKYKNDIKMLTDRMTDMHLSDKRTCSVN